MTTTPTPSDNPQQGPLLTLAEASAYLRCSKAHVSNLIRGLVPNSQPLPAVRLGRRVYVRRDSLARYLRVVESRYDDDGQDSTP
ncbi:MAG: helix-turn-helix domain-containing protein [Acidobacteria bacterium]|nr:helix-turn-helix domain-containing protein [Acidobacteriota bacterium]